MARTNTQVMEDRSYLPWTRREDRRILAVRRPEDRFLARELGRSRNAIRIRRSRLNNR